MHLPSDSAGDRPELSASNRLAPAGPTPLEASAATGQALHNERSSALAARPAVLPALGPAALGQPARLAGRTVRLLLVEDDRLLADSLSRLLEQAGFTVYVTAFGEDALDLARTYRFDTILLDLTLPDMSGDAVLASLRELRRETPVIILSGADDLGTKLDRFQQGADDYLTKPFAVEELIARVHALLRRVQASAPTEILLGPLLMDLASRRAAVDGVPVPLTGKEFACLEYLAQRRGMTVTKEMFLAHLYGGRDEPEMKIIDVFICKIRRKLAEAGAPPLIETVWGRGYTIPHEA